MSDVNNSTWSWYNPTSWFYYSPYNPLSWASVEAPGNISVHSKDTSNLPTTKPVIETNSPSSAPCINKTVDTPQLVHVSILHLFIMHNNSFPLSFL